MSDFHLFPANEPPPHPSPRAGKGGKLFTLVSLALVTLLLVGGGAFFVGQRTTSEEKAAPTPSLLSLFTSVTPTQAPTSTPTPISTPPAGGLSGTPTKSPTTSVSPTPMPKSLTLSSEKTLDGFRSSNGGGNSGMDVRAGRNTSLVTRGFVSFDLSKIPQGAKINEATLRTYQTRVEGNPYSVGGALKIDHLNYGDSLDDTDYGMAALLSSFATLSGSSGSGWKEAEVTRQVADDYANARSRSQFRLRFTTEVKGGDTTGDFAYFEGGDNSEGTGNIPQLIVKY